MVSSVRVYYSKAKQRQIIPARNFFSPTKKTYDLHLKFQSSNTVQSENKNAFIFPVDSKYKYLEEELNKLNINDEEWVDIVINSVQTIPSDTVQYLASNRFYLIALSVAGIGSALNIAASLATLLTLGIVTAGSIIPVISIVFAATGFAIIAVGSLMALVNAIAESAVSKPQFEASIKQAGNPESQKQLGYYATQQLFKQKFETPQEFDSEERSEGYQTEFKPV